MSLSGRLEDLQPRDLLQILGLSHCSGLLQLRSGELLAELLFDNGLVVSAWRGGTSQSDGAVAMPCDTVDAELLNHARKLQPKIKPFRSLDLLLVENYGLAEKKLYARLRPAVFALVKKLLGCDEGEFLFRPGSIHETLEQIASGEHLCLDKGFSAAELLRDETTLLPEAEDLPGTIAEVGKAMQEYHDLSCDGEVVLLVDDDLSFGRHAVAALTGAGLQARCFATGRELLEAARACWQSRRRALLVIDLIMPRQHGGGLLGGLELVEQICRLQPDQACLVYSDFPCPEIEQRLQQLGIDNLLDKPRPMASSGETDYSLTDEFCRHLAEGAATRLGVTDPVAAAVDADNGDGATAVEDSMTDNVPPSGAGLGVLKGMLQEMQSAENRDQIMLLVLRFATEMLSRAILFSVDDEYIAGVGQFGHGDGGGPADQKVRSIVIPLAEQSSLGNVVEKGIACRGPLDKDGWDARLGRELGLDQNDEVFIGPIVSGDRVMALLCGDNLSAGCGLEQCQMLEIFLQQTGVALEKLKMSDNLGGFSALLEKRFG